jgi:hypothetical protein
MTFGKDLTIDVVALDEGHGKIIIEISFQGVHDHMWPYRDKIQDYLQEEIAKHEPDAIILDFLNYQYDFGNELFAPIFTVSWDSKNNKIRPCSIIAAGQTAKSLKSLLVESMIYKVLNIELFCEKEKALEYVKRRFDSTIP